MQGAMKCTIARNVKIFHGYNMHGCNELWILNIFSSQWTYNKLFWQDVSKLILKAFDINIRLCHLDILFGIPFEKDMFIIINFHRMSRFVSLP